MSKVVENDLGWKELSKKLSKLPFEIRVGVQGNEAQKDHDGISNVQLGAIHEYGTSDGRIPARSFLRSTLIEKESSYLEMFKKILSKVIDGSEVRKQFSLLGELARSDVIMKIKSGISPPLKPSTIAHKKGETTPLIDTGQLWNAISYEIVDRK